jgi:hypothetical protein
MIDMGFSLQSYTPGRFPLSTILEFPFMFSSSLQACQVAAELFKTNTAFQEEYSEVKVIMDWYHRYVSAYFFKAGGNNRRFQRIEDPHTWSGSK